MQVFSKTVYYWINDRSTDYQVTNLIYLEYLFLFVSKFPLNIMNSLFSENPS